VKKKKNPCLTRAATTGSFFIAAAADSALKGVADKDLVLRRVRGEGTHRYIFLMGL